MCELLNKTNTIRKYVVKNTFKDYLPNISDYEIVEEIMPTVNSGQFLVKTEYISVDPYMRSFANNFKVPYDQFGFQVGKVIKSNNPDYLVDTYVVSHSGWRNFVILNGDRDVMFGMKPYIPNINDLPLSFSLGILGMPGITAYLGLLNICKPQSGEVVCISSAAGAVGSLVGQIAKLKGCIVIGFAGTDEKVNILKQLLGFHHAFNYKTVSISESLKRVAPDGIDCYFNNVGGDLSAFIIQNMKIYGRVAVCGSISTYGPHKTNMKSLRPPDSIKIKSFIFTQWTLAEQEEALSQLRKWIDDKNILVKETLYNGFDNLPQALLSMLSGDNIGKAVVAV